MESGNLERDSQGLFNNPYPELIQPKFSLWFILILSSHLRLGLPKGLFPRGLPVKILKVLLPSSFLATCPAHHILLDSITLTNKKVQTMIFLIVESSPIHIRIPLGSTYFPQDPVFKYP